VSELKKQAKTLEKDIQLYRDKELENKNRLKNPWFRAWRDSLLFSKDIVGVAEELEAENKKLREKLIIRAELFNNATNFVLELQDENDKLEAQIADVAKFLKTLIELTPIPKKISTYDPETKEDWTIETADPEEYRRLFDFLDENVGRLRAALQKEANGEKQK